MVTGMAWAKNPMLPRLKDLHAEGEKYILRPGAISKGLVACCHSFCLFYLFLTLHHGCNGFLHDEAGGLWWVMTCNGDLHGIGGFQNVVMVNLLGSGGL
jgi:hypothetical protein